MTIQEKEPRESTTLAVVGMLLIPLISVSTAIFAADAATAANQSSVHEGLLATLIGAVAGACSWHVIVKIVDGVGVITSGLVSRRPNARLGWILGAPLWLKPAVALVPIGLPGLSPLRRRGPPVGLD